MLVGLSTSVLCFEEYSEQCSKPDCFLQLSRTPSAANVPSGGLCQWGFTLVLLRVFQHLQPRLQLLRQKEVELCVDSVWHLSGSREDGSCAWSSRPMWMSWKTVGILVVEAGASWVFERPVTQPAEGGSPGMHCSYSECSFRPWSCCQRAPSASPFLDMSCLCSNIPSDTLPSVLWSWLNAITNATCP